VFEAGAEFSNIICMSFVFHLFITTIHTRCEVSVILRTPRYVTVTSQLRHDAAQFSKSTNENRQVGREILLATHTQPRQNSRPARRNTRQLGAPVTLAIHGCSWLVCIVFRT
jgi:hypothetical protein